jgi:hypothetical protein
MAEKLTFNPDLTAGYQVSSVLFNWFVTLHHCIIYRHYMILERFCRMMLANELGVISSLWLTG